MNRNTNFWLGMAVFQTFFGMAVFAATRQYYNQQANDFDINQFSADRPALTAPVSNRESVLEEVGLSSSLPESSVPEIPITTDPIELSRQANEFFAARQYDTAAGLYERLLSFDPGNVDTYNNLGITLHYIGRSTEAITRLTEGVAVDPESQRIWLTLGFVHNQLGNTVQARSALTRATDMGTDNDVGRSALEILENLSQ